MYNKQGISCNKFNTRYVLLSFDLINLIIWNCSWFISFVFFVWIAVFPKSHPGLEGIPLRLSFTFEVSSYQPYWECKHQNILKWKSFDEISLLEYVPERFDCFGKAKIRNVDSFVGLLECNTESGDQTG